MKQLFFLLFCAFFGLLDVVEAQGTFQRVSTGTDDYLFSIKNLGQEGYVSLGLTTSYGAGEFDFYLMRFDKRGDLLWSKTYGGPLGDYGYSLVPTDDNGFVLLGNSQSFGAGSSDVCLIKVDENGHVVWSKTYGGSGFDDGFELELTNDNGLIIVGRTTSFGAGSGDVYLIKTDLNGEVLWNKTFGGFGNEDAQQVKQTLDNGYIIVGHTFSYGAGNADVYLIKTDAAGEMIWAKTYGGENFDYGNSIAQTSDGGFILTGNTNSFGLTKADALLMKLDPAGNIVWSKTYGGEDTDYGHYVIENPDGGFTVTGQTNSFGGGLFDAYLIRTNSTGDTLWTRSYGGDDDDFSNAVDQGIDGGFVIAGNSWSQRDQSLSYFIKTDAEGNSGCHQFYTTTKITSPTFTTGIGAMINSGIQISSPTILAESIEAADSSLCELSVSVTENEHSDLWEYKIYPNPIVHRSILQINNHNQAYSLRFFNSYGQLVYEKNNSTDRLVEIEKNNWASGIYYFQLIAKEQIRASGKLIIN